MTASPDPVLPPGERSAIVRDGVAVGIATGAYGISFGAISVAAGLDVWQTCALSLLVFTGASQFALVGVVAAGGSPLSGAVTGLLLGTRNTLYGIRLAPLLGWRGWRRGAAAHLLIDESTAMAVTRETTAAARVGFLATGLAVFVLWNLATLGGALAGEALGDPRTYGLDAAVGGAFLALLWPRLKDRRNQLTAVLAAALVLTLVPVAPAGVPVLAAAVVALVVGVVSHATDPTEVPGRDDLPGGGEHQR
ncbi:AzlC family ABC transporter permease [Nocardioides sp. WL0053]|uniref:AzlC family ABC transporter permease n=1 Tax=Nocardioides jiangsuensis TaxID=2866161 RepID=A0ABS7RPJ7_9ACTN|nr:AzlC family ABC transporter permease [Nocardioides jiangsuensis]MBY9075850.1 AzlC family ABC transporter permease [Nocardioides jiangsuensis]